MVKTLDFSVAEGVQEAAEVGAEGAQDGGGGSGG